MSRSSEKWEKYPIRKNRDRKSSMYISQGEFADFSLRESRRKYLKESTLIEKSCISDTIANICNNITCPVNMRESECLENHLEWCDSKTRLHEDPSEETISLAVREAHIRKCEIVRTSYLYLIESCTDQKCSLTSSNDHSRIFLFMRGKESHTKRCLSLWEK